MENENIAIMSSEYSRAVSLNQHIKVHAELAQQSLYEMCKGLKEMRDDKLYKELDYQNFEEYCEKEVGLTRQQTYNFISIAENLSEDFVKSILQIGTTKLALLAKLDEPQREEIIQNVDLENTSVKELKEEIKSLKSEISLKDDNILNLETNYENLEKRHIELGHEKMELSATLRESQDTQKNLVGQIEDLESKLQERQEEFDDFKAGAKRRQDMLLDKTRILTEQVKELESRPVEVAVQEADTSEIDRLTSENEELKKQLAEKPMIQETFSDGKSFSEMQAEFRAYLKTLDDAMKHLCAFIARNEKEYDMWRYISEITEKIDIYIKVMRKEKEKCQ